MGSGSRYNVSWVALVGEALLSGLSFSDAWSCVPASTSDSIRLRWTTNRVMLRRIRLDIADDDRLGYCRD